MMMKKLHSYVLKLFCLGLLLSVGRSEFSWSNTDYGFIQGIGIRYERWLVNDLDSEPLWLADSGESYATIGFGEAVFYDDWTEPYDGRYGEFESGVHYLVIPSIEYIDEWPDPDVQP
jgi:hypothetical protein